MSRPTARLALYGQRGRRLVQQGGVTVNDQKADSIDARWTAEDFSGDDLVIRKGKKSDALPASDFLLCKSIANGHVPSPVTLEFQRGRRYGTKNGVLFSERA